MSRLQPAPKPDQSDRSPSGDWKYLPLLLLPVVCCGLPLAIGAGVAIGAAAWAGGAVAAATVAALASIVVMRRRRRCSPADDYSPRIAPTRGQDGAP